MDRQRLIVMMEIAVMAGLAYVLGMFKLFQMPQGGSISLIMLPIALIAVRRGLVAGLITGLIVGELDHLIGGYVVHPIQLLLDYPIAYMAVGLAGLCSVKGWLAHVSQTKKLWIGLTIGVTARFVCHFTSGVVWFGEYAPEGMPVALYSALYNASYLVPELVIAGVVLTLLVKKAPTLAQAATRA